MRFEHDLIKGRIGETIFELMFRETGEYTVLRFGYESTHSIVAQYQHLARRTDVIDQVRHNPDFVLINDNKTQFYFIEVKYRAELDMKNLLEIAEKMEVRWGISHLFVISSDGFYYSSVHDIIRRNGEIAKLPTSIVSEVIQTKYLKLVKEFLG